MHWFEMLQPVIPQESQRFAGL